MTIITARPLARKTAQKNYSNTLFSLDIHHTFSETEILMKLHSPILNTCELPYTFTALQMLFPGVLSTQCFNDDDLPFAQEVRKTEIAHLFEHILLEYLCEMKVARNDEDCVFEGNTAWDWYKEPVGTFHITLNAGWQNANIFEEALEKSIYLLKILMQGIHPQALTHDITIHQSYLTILGNR